MIDNHILSCLISLAEMICSDTKTFSTEQCTELLDKFLYQSSIVRPLSHADQQRLLSYYSQPLSLNELKTLCSPLQSDLNDLLSSLKQRSLMNNDELLDFLTNIIVNIFENRQQFSDEKCQELKDLIEKKRIGKKRYRLINETFKKCRLNKTNPPTINRAILSQLLNRILLYDHQVNRNFLLNVRLLLISFPLFEAYLEFLTLLKNISQTINFKQVTIEFEIVRCLLSTIILVITDTDMSDASKIVFFRQDLKAIIEKQNRFFSVLLTDQQYELVMTRLASTSDINLLINLMKTNLNEQNYHNFIYFIQNELNDKNDFEKIINFIVDTFDNQLLSIEQTLEISNLIFRHSKLNYKTYKNLLRFFIDLLELGIHSSPKVYLNLIKNNQENDQIINQITIILKIQSGKYAIAEWKRTMIDLLKVLFNRLDKFERLRTLSQQSPMFQDTIFKKNLETYWKTTLDNQRKDDEERKFVRNPMTHKTFFDYLHFNQFRD